MSRVGRLYMALPCATACKLSSLSHSFLLSFSPTHSSLPSLPPSLPKELYVKRLHHILTSLIVHMHLKVKEMCYQASDQGSGRSFIHRSAGGKQATNLQDFLYLVCQRPFCLSDRPSLIHRCV